MGVAEHWYIDPLSGDDITGDGTSDATAWQTLQHAWDNFTAATGNNWEQFNIKDSGAYTISADLDTTTAKATRTPTGHRPWVLRGYTLVANDGGQAHIDRTGTGLTGVINDDAVNGVHIIDMEISKNPVSTGDIINLNDDCLFLNLVVHGSSSGWAIQVDHQGKFFNCHIYDTANGILCNSRSGIISNCFVEDGVNNALDIGISAGSGIAIGNRVKVSGSNSAISLVAPGGKAINNNVYNSLNQPGSRGINCDGDGVVCINNIIENFDVGVYVEASESVALLGYNSFYNNTTNIDESSSGGIINNLGNDIILTASPFTDAANGDLSTIHTELTRAYPNFAQLGDAVQTYLDRGAIQTDCPQWIDTLII